jgi:hypothetical protein
MQATIVSGDAPVNGAQMSADLSDISITYNVFLNRAPDDPQPPNDPSARLFLTSTFYDGDGCRPWASRRSAASSQRTRAR